jgi:putative PIN family toxin of toxin-antitoxin system
MHGKIFMRRWVVKNDTGISAVLDTRILVSYLLTQGETLSSIVDHWQQGRFVVVASLPVLGELIEVVARPCLRHVMSADPQALFDAIEQGAILVPGELFLSVLTRDPTNDIFIACAVEGEADYLVTSSTELLNLGSYKSVQMIAPAAFLQILDGIE